MKKYLYLFCIALLASSCYEANLDCKSFKTGTYLSEISIQGKKHYTTSIRTDKMVIETYKGKTDTASIRWVNDCEFILTKLHPKTIAEQHAVSIRIRSSKKNSYTFDYGIVGNPHREQGKATKLTN
ncbi:MAG: DNA topoisomerase IV [Flavobacterium sp.]|nr:DNA topoisomerase IV [Flavobacterium sp.]